jgi:hypothetical protein
MELTDREVGGSWCILEGKMVGQMSRARFVENILSVCGVLVKPVKN